MQSMLFLTQKFKLLIPLFLIFIVLFFGLYSPLGSFIGTPKFWHDEAVPFDIARTFLETGVLDAGIAPGVAFAQHYMTHATGFTVTVPLAGFFYLFGIGVLQSRIYMLLWLCLAVFSAWLVMRSFFGKSFAFQGVLLMATFAPFYANGKTSTGEIPGFFFLLVSLWMLYQRNAYVSGGALAGLALVSKPSVYILLLPALFLEIITEERKKSLFPLIYFGLGILPILLFWIWLILPQPFIVSSWTQMIYFYQHAFNDVSLWSHLSKDFLTLFTHSTIIYTAFLFFIAFIAYQNIQSLQVKRLVRFSLLYFIFAFIYFLRSPGWLRYLVVAQMLFLLLTPFFLGEALKRMRIKLPRYSGVYIILLLLVLQSLNFFFFADIQSSLRSIHAAQYINERLQKNPESTVGIAFDAPVAAQISSLRKYQIASVGGEGVVFGEHPLSLPKDRLPTFFFGKVTSEEERRTLNDFYKEDSMLRGFFERRP